MSENILLLTDIINLNNADITGGCVVAVGNFDGVHSGHKKMLTQLKAESLRLNLPAAVYTFDPYDSPKADARLIALPEKKYELLRDSGVDIVFSAPFSTIKDLTARDFTEKVLYTAIGAKSIICGYDFRFGKDRQGDAMLIKQLLSDKGVNVITANAECIENEPVSSTAIRSLIASGNIRKANRLLGRGFSFNAVVCDGKKLGRMLGFPTINQEYPASLILPRFGVYAVNVFIDGKTYRGVANVGTKPTVSQDERPVCETHILDYSGDCYGKDAEIEFLDFIREEKRFSSLDKLKAQIAQDIEIISKGVYL